MFSKSYEIQDLRHLHFSARFWEQLYFRTVDALATQDYSCEDRAWSECNSRAASVFTQHMNLPNSLTTLRIFFVPLLVVVLLTRTRTLIFGDCPIHFEVWGVLILLAAAATDAADGYFARKRDEVTTLGILLDPIADKLLISAAFISLVGMGLVPGVDGGDHHRARVHRARACAISLRAKG